MENNNDLNNNIKNNDIDISATEPENVTREINLDDLYDGAINNTVVLDPITKDEVLLEPKRGSGKAIGVFFAILILLTLYFVNNKMDIENTEGNVVPNVTTTNTTLSNIQHNKGILTCTYTSISSSDNQKATYVLKYEDDKILNSSFNYDVVLITETISDSVLELMGEYENSYINNLEFFGSNINFEKNEKGFTYNWQNDYTTTNLNNFLYEDGKTKLFAKPSADDTIENVKENYINKGYNCIISGDSNE